jgi:hypothetical protein
VWLNTGPSASGASGAILLRTGAAGSVATRGAGGGLSVTVGTSATAVGADVVVAAGSSAAATGGSVVIVAGTGGANPVGATSRGSITFSGPLRLAGTLVATTVASASPTLDLSFTVNILQLTSAATFALPTPTRDGKLLMITRRSRASEGLATVSTSAAGTTLFVVVGPLANNYATSAQLVDAGDHLQVVWRATPSPGNWLVISHDATFS